jgi:hypothetical protein
MYTRLTLRNRIATDTRETQINTTIEDYLNLTLQEIQSPAWAFEQAGLKGFDHKWSFNRRKATLLISGETAQLPRDLDDIALIRQITSPTKINFIPDDLFYEMLPNPTATGNPKLYRIWEQEGVEVRLSADDTIEVLSSSASDTTQTVRIVGKDANGLLRTESLTLTGTTAAAGSITYNAGDVLRISKSADTVGIITVRKATADVTLVLLAPTETSARFKIISFYPIPPSTAGVIVSVANYTATVTGTVKITDVGHGLSTGATITISGTTNYNGNYSVTVIDDDSFYITATYVATETGTWIIYTTAYLEYFTHIRRLEGDNDVPDLAEKWMWLVRTGAMAKVYQYQNKESLFNTTQALFASGLRSMVREDLGNSDYIPVMRGQLQKLNTNWINLLETPIIT